LNLFRIGGEALLVAGYAWTLTAFVTASMPDNPVADATAAGIPGHPHEYAAAFHDVVVVLALLVAVTAAAVVLLTRSRKRTDVSSAA
ncbi:MAG: MFS transporter, partial [Rhodococcus fascians]